MKRLVTNILAYLISVIIGFSTLAIFSNILVYMGAFPEDQASLLAFREGLVRGCVFVWLGGVLAGLFYFWIHGKSRILFLLMPVLMPLGFCFYYSAVNL